MKHLLLVVAISISGCGLTDIAEQTQSAVQASNETQSDILMALQRTERLTQALRELMEKTASGVHLQLLTVALEQMLSPSNTSMLTPPVRMIPFAQAYANEATPLEIVQTAHLLFLDALMGPENEIQGRVASLVAMSLIGAFTPPDKFQAIERDQIRDQGRYESATYRLFTGRYMAVRDYLLGDILDNSSILNIGSLVEAVVYFKQLAALTGCDYARELSVNVPTLGISAQVEVSEVQAVGVRAYKKFVSALRPEILAKPEVVSLLQVFSAHHQNLLAAN